jgi:hypothetical protein
MQWDLERIGRAITRGGADSLSVGQEKSPDLGARLFFHLPRRRAEGIIKGPPKMMDTFYISANTPTSEYASFRFGRMELREALPTW